jgi:hypothetical protein
MVLVGKKYYDDFLVLVLAACLRIKCNLLTMYFIFFGMLVQKFDTQSRSIAS